VSNLSGTVLLNQAYQATFVASSTIAPTVPVVLDFQDESKINNMLIVETPRQVTQAVKEQKKEKQNQSSNEEDTKPKKGASTKSESNKTAVSQVDTPAAAETVAKTEETPPVEVKLDLAAIQPAVLQAAAQAIEKVVAPAAPVVPVLVSMTTNPGWSTDGVNAVLSLDNNGQILYYSTKANASLTVDVTTAAGTKTYPLNFGDKLKVNVTQKK
jgi:hypothetical protein